MNLNLDGLDAEPAAPAVEAVETPPAAPAAPENPPPVVAEAAAPAVAPAPETGRVIPLAAHLEERNALKARIAALEEAAKPRPAPVEAPKPVDFMEDPTGFIDQKIQPIVAKAQATEAELQQFREREQINSLISEADAAQAEFSKTHADYQAALDHVRTTRMAQLRLMDSEATEAQLKQAITREEIIGIAAAKQRGINPAELAYNYAKTLGYRTPAPTPAPVVAAPVVVAPDTSAARSLGAGGGGSDSAEGEENEMTEALKARFRR